MTMLYILLGSPREMKKKGHGELREVPSMSIASGFPFSFFWPEADIEET